ncbi:hypothetical protein GCM10007183_09070 [Staphylococcus muscae]|uniref:Uncharacterized protein n=1 Tax=Staphylococcus muscae TaxID=1294 RepID=A0ABQ1HSJ6_9STAP|nr:hypothetical protein GCM10007183_09070 [Staphylococcus muscae]
MSSFRKTIAVDDFNKVFQLYDFHIGTPIYSFKLSIISLLILVIYRIAYYNVNEGDKCVMSR